MISPFSFGPRFSHRALAWLGENCYFSTMAATSRLLAKGDGWQVRDVTCDSGPADKPFEEAHAEFSIAAVAEGTFQYRTDLGRVLLGPGSWLLGNPGQCYQCGHEHGVGDRCLAFQFSPVFLEDVAADLPGVTRLSLDAAHLPPASSLLPVMAEALSARDSVDPAALEEVALRVAAAAFRSLSAGRKAAAPSRRDLKRISDALRLIEAEADMPLTVNGLARRVAMSPYHFLRSFARVVGVTPHQYILQTRFRRVLQRLRRSEDSVSTIAYDAGFGDLSTFNRRFKEIAGMTPGAWRRP